MVKILFCLVVRRTIQIIIMIFDCFIQSCGKCIPYYVNHFIVLKQKTTVNIALKFAKQIEYEYVYH